jgi:hypothetical protein
VTAAALGGQRRETGIEIGKNQSLTWLGLAFAPQERMGVSDRRRHDHRFLGTVVWYRHVRDLPAPRRYYSQYRILDMMQQTIQYTER